MSKNNANPFFSIIIPVYKVEEYLEQCVESVLAQRYSDYELILVDDGSPDRCPQMCDAFTQKDSRITVIHKPNGGLSDARNAGIRAARGTYICFLDSDDYWDDENALKKIKDEIEKSSPDLVQYGVRKYYQQKGVLDQAEIRDFTNYKTLNAEETVLMLVKEGKLSISACLQAISKEFLLKHELFFAKGIKCEDIEWGIRLFAAVPCCAFLPDSFYIYRMQREGSITATLDDKHLANYASIIQSSIQVAQNGSPIMRNALMSYTMYHVMIISALSYRKSISAKQGRLVRSAMKDICKTYLLAHQEDKRVAMTARLYRIMGYYGMAYALGIYLKYRGR